MESGSLLKMAPPVDSSEPGYVQEGENNLRLFLLQSATLKPKSTTINRSSQHSAEIGSQPPAFFFFLIHLPANPSGFILAGTNNNPNRTAFMFLPLLVTTTNMTKTWFIHPFNLFRHESACVCVYRHWVPVKKDRDAREGSRLLRLKRRARFGTRSRRCLTAETGF